MFKIGDFSKLVRVSPRMLRHYEKCGLLAPADVDRFTGYRLYSAGQVPLASHIATLRDVGFSIDEIGALLPHREDPAYMDEALRAKAATLRARIEAERDRVDRLMQLCAALRKENIIMVYEVELKPLPAVQVLSLRGIIPRYRDEGLLWEKLGQYIGEQKIVCHSDGYSTYFDEEYRETGPDVEIAVPVDTLGTSRGEFVYKEYEEIPLAATVRFSGPFDGGYDAACEKLANWMEQNGYAFAGPLRGHVLMSPDDAPSPEDWMTELQAPVARK